MKAIVLTYDRYRLFTEHMLKTYSVLWPDNPFTFVIPFQDNSTINSHGQRIELVNCKREIVPTVLCLLDTVGEEEWVYWCIDDKFLINIDKSAASSISHFVENISDRRVTGFCFCRARFLLDPEHVAEVRNCPEHSPFSLVRRLNYNHIWLHQFIRASSLRSLFLRFPKRDFQAIEMDTFTRQGPDAWKVPDDEIMYVTKENLMTFGESTVQGKMTRGCLDNMARLGVKTPDGFDIEEVDIRIGRM